MNNDNNIFGNINPIPPTNNSNEPTTNPNISANGLITITPIPDSKDNSSQTTQTKSQEPSPINPQVIFPEANNTSTQETSLTQEVPTSSNNQEVLNPNIIIPEQKNDSLSPKDNININSNIINKTPELKLDGTSPFDIGVNTNIQPENTITPNQPINENINTIPVNQQNIPNKEFINPPINNINISNDNIVSVGKYLINMILFSIPIIGFIMLILKAIDKKDKNISNFAKAYLLLGVILIALWLVFVAIFGATLISLGNMQY